MQVNLYEAKTQLSRLVEKALAGEEGGDWYKVQVWPAPESPRRIIKRWSVAA